MADASVVSVSMVEPDIAVLTLDDPHKGVNILSQSVLEEFEHRLDELDAQPDLVGLIIVSGKPGSFIAGADLREFAAAEEITKESVSVAAPRWRCGAIGG